MHNDWHTQSIYGLQTRTYRIDAHDAYAVQVGDYNSQHFHIRDTPVGPEVTRNLELTADAVVPLTFKLELRIFDEAMQMTRLAAASQIAPYTWLTTARPLIDPEVIDSSILLKVDGGYVSAGVLWTDSSTGLALLVSESRGRSQAPVSDTAVSLGDKLHAFGYTQRGERLSGDYVAHQLIGSHTIALHGPCVGSEACGVPLVSAETGKLSAILIAGPDQHTGLLTAVSIHALPWRDALPKMLTARKQVIANRMSREAAAEQRRRETAARQQAIRDEWAALCEQVQIQVVVAPNDANIRSKRCIVPTSDITVGRLRRKGLHPLCCTASCPQQPRHVPYSNKTQDPLPTCAQCIRTIYRITKRPWNDMLLGMQKNNRYK